MHCQAMTLSEPRRATLRKMLNKVPEVTLYFWIVKERVPTLIVGDRAAPARA